jgi:hypothetical protein
MTGSCQKTEAVARLETSYWQRQLPELRKNGADHFSRLSGRFLFKINTDLISIDNIQYSRPFQNDLGSEIYPSMQNKVKQIEF